MPDSRQHKTDRAMKLAVMNRIIGEFQTVSGIPVTVTATNDRGLIELTAHDGLGNVYLMRCMISMRKPRRGPYGK